MPVIPLPAQPSLDNLRQQARTLQRLAAAGLPGALGTVAEFRPQPGSLLAGDPRCRAISLADAQLVIARQYGFASWLRLRRHLAVLAEYSRSPRVQPTGGPLPAAAGGAGLADDFLRLACLVYDGYDPARTGQARQILTERPETALVSIYTCAAAGEHEQASALLRADPALARRQGGPFGWDPLLYAAYSRVVPPWPGWSTLETARQLLAAGADPNAGYLWAGLPSPFTALAGALGRGEGAPPAHPQAMELATLLLESGADANDSQALYNCGLQSPPDDDAYLRLLLHYGLGRGDGGPWHRRLAPAHHSPRQLLDEELIKAVAKDLPQRVALLLAHGADPAGLGAQHPVHRQHDAWQLATMGGHREVLELLAGTGPAPEPDPVLSFLGACMAGDAGQVRALRRADPGIAAEAVAREPDLLVEAAEQGRPAAIRLLAAAGFDVNALRRAGARNGALHEAAWNGSMVLVELLLGLGADPALQDLTYHSTAAGWAETNGQDEVAAYLAGLEISGPDGAAGQSAGTPD